MTDQTFITGGPGRRTKQRTLTEVVKSALNPAVRPHVIRAAWQADQTGMVLLVLVDRAGSVQPVRSADWAIRLRLKKAGQPVPARLDVAVPPEAVQAA